MQCQAHLLKIVAARNASCSFSSLLNSWQKEADARDKSRTVVVGYLSRHPKYGKYVRRRTILQVHDEENVSKKGDLVEVRECAPKSKTKSWEVVRVVRSAEMA